MDFSCEDKKSFFSWYLKYLAKTELAILYKAGWRSINNLFDMRKENNN